MATPQVAKQLISVALPVMYVEPGKLIAYAYVYLDGWAQLGDALRAIEPRGVYPRLSYVYQAPESGRLLGLLALDVTALGSDEAATYQALGAIPGLRVVAVQRPEGGVAAAELQTPTLVGTPAVLFGRPIISSLTQGIVKAQGGAGERLLHELGRDAGTLAASALPPLLRTLGLTLSADLLMRRLRDLQVMGWAVLRDARLSDEHHGEVTLADTFESAAWEGKASSPKCHFLSGFIGGVFSFAWQHPFECREVECQATGAPACRFAFQPASP